MASLQASPPHTPKRILAVKLADLGDLLTITPALQALRAAHPAARIDLLAPPSSAHLLDGAPYVDTVITFDKFPFDSLSGLLDVGRVLQSLRFLFGLRLARYDTLAMFHHYTLTFGAMKFAAVALASGASVRAGLDNGKGWFLTQRAPDRGFGTVHEIAYWLEVAALLGADTEAGWRPHMPVGPEHRAAADNSLAQMGINHATNVIALHPGAGFYSRARIWPAERFARVARGLIECEEAHVIVLGGPDEVEMAAVIEQECGCPEHIHNLAGRTTIHETAAIIQQCDLFLGNDSGPMHIAAALGVPVVAVFGPSNRRAWGPYTPPGEPEQHTIVSRDLPCMPCLYRGHTLGLREGCGPRPCLTGLPAEPVLQACREKLTGRQAAKVITDRRNGPRLRERTAD
jgi:lipopolysaccharide heptosyltransferase II